MKIRETSAFDGRQSRFDAAAAEDTLRELEEQFAAGDIDARSYLVKKQSLVRLFVKATTSPVRRRREENYDGE
ncbi:hypothetical protein MUN76_12110 [Leucobacter rhizosphaerae]|uniref:Uncharacterized protein n=1 Tax=Leucobacter rhizosphaerae TaxID=2932245 RepID=A0ABY4FUC3_9MICO|nr:hypothetical protein [Leucobacter rhizosphaerae]UOQ59784.1 hypothetical protein MUN76_12110 [Leucobacter rhizosphaerae]